MKERPIIFNDEMVRAIFDGRKTQTRRPIKHTPDEDCPYHENGVAVASPYGRIGDRLWVRECFADDAGGTRKFLGEHIYYRADPLHPVFVDGGWTASIHMPRWASRITLEITSTRIERLHDISEEDATAEGVQTECEEVGRRCWFNYMWPGTRVSMSAAASFASLWQSIYGAGSWDKPQRVWVYEFKRVEV